MTGSVPRAVASGLHAQAPLATARGTDPYCHLRMGTLICNPLQDKNQDSSAKTQLPSLLRSIGLRAHGAILFALMSLKMWSTAPPPYIAYTGRVIIWCFERVLPVSLSVKVN